MKKSNLLNALTVSDVYDLLVKKPTTINPDSSIVEMLEKMIEDLKTRHIYIVDDNNRLLGVVRMTTVAEMLFPLVTIEEITSDPYLFRNIKFDAQSVHEVMNKNPRMVHMDTGLHELARIFVEEKVTELPIVDDSNVLLGQVNMYEIIKAYLGICQH